jgi:DNA invertase Pin-like site-specific DNA recombinase
MCRAKIESLGGIVAQVFVDRDTSAYKKVKRPYFDAMWEGLENGRFDAVCVWKLDRLTRRFVDTGPILKRLEEHGAKLLSVVDNIDTSTPMGQAIVGVLIAQAESESLNTSVRVKAAREAEAAQGKHHGGRRCFGYTKDQTLDPIEFPIAREIVDRILRGDSLRSISRWLNDSGVVTTSGKPWAAVTVKQWLRAPSIAGIRTHHDVETPGDWPAIITSDEREAILLRLGTTLPSGKPATVKNLLSGFIYCVKCGNKMYVQHSGGSDRQKARYRYCCQKDAPGACGSVFVAQAAVEAVVVERLISFMVNVQRRPIEGDRDIVALRHAIEEDEASLVDISRERFVGRTMDDKVYRTLSRDIKERLEASRQTLAAWEQTAKSDIPTGDRQAIEAWWQAASIEAQRVALEQCVEYVLVNPAKVRGRHFDPRRVGVRFKFEAFGSLTEGYMMDEWGNTFRAEILPAELDEESAAMAERWAKAQAARS